jgi:hypothetical protein
VRSFRSVASYWLVMTEFLRHLYNTQHSTCLRPYIDNSRLIIRRGIIPVKFAKGPNQSALIQQLLWHQRSRVKCTILQSARLDNKADCCCYKAPTKPSRIHCSFISTCSLEISTLTITVRQWDTE